MSNFTRYIPKLNDRDLIRAFETVAKKHEGATIAFQDAFGQLDQESIEKFKKLSGFFLSSAVLRIGHCTWQVQRLRAEHANDPHNATHDKLMFGWNQQSGQPDRVLTVTVSAALDVALSRPLAQTDTGSDGVLPIASHSEVLLAMESVAASILTDATLHRQKLEDAYLEKERALNARVDEQRARELERVQGEKERIDGELAERKSTLDEREQSLEALQKTLDDRNNTHVRREIRSSLLELAKERLANFGVSRQTRAQYIAVHIAAIAGLVILAGGSFFYGSRIAVDPSSNNYPPEIIVLAIKSGALAAATIALGSWYLGWLNRWLQRIADAEFKLQQFRLDIERASWLAETVLEWKATSSEPFPELLATRLSIGLFQSSSTEFDDPKSPAGHLAEALFGAAASAKLRLGEQEINFDRRSIKGLNE